MASGSFGVTSNNQYIVGRVDWSSSTNVANNQSTVTATLYMWRNNTGYTTYGSGSFTININGNQKTNSSTFTFNYNSNTQCVTHTVVVPHNADGTKSISISVSGGLPSTSFTATYGITTVTLDTIPRATQPTLDKSTVNYGSPVIITLNRASSGFTHTIRYDWNSNTGTIATGVSTSYTWVVPSSFMNYIPNASASWGRIIVDTYNGSSLVGTKEVRLDTIVPSNIVPSFTAITHSETVTSVSTAIGAYVQNLSKLQLNITGAAGAYSSTISSYSITFDGATYNSNTATTGIIKSSGTLTLTGTVTDSRGRSASMAINITVLPYNLPQVTNFTVERCDAAGTPNLLGTYVKVTRAATISSLNSKNTLTHTVYSKVRGNATWTQNSTTTLIAGTTSLNTYTVISTFPITSSYDFRLDITDKFNTTICLLVVPTGTVTMSWGKTGIGVGKVWEQGILDVNGDIYESGSKLSDKYLQMANEPQYIKGSNSTGTDNQYTDTNAIWKSGFYDINGGSNNPAGSNRIGLLNVAHGGDNPDYKIGGQFGIEIANNGRAWFRSRDQNGTGTWQQLISTTPRFTWSGIATYNTAITITHNLGYYPLVSLESQTLGNVNTLWKHLNTNQIQIYNWNGGSNNATVVVRCY